MWRSSRPSRQKLPLTCNDLRHVHDSLPHPLAHDNLLFLSLLITGFFGLMRLGELVQSDSSAIRSTFFFLSFHRRLAVTPRTQAVQRL